MAPIHSRAVMAWLMSLSPYTTGGSALHVLTEVSRRSAEGALNSVGYRFITSVEHRVEQIEDKVDNAIRHLRLNECGAIGFWLNLQVSDLAAGRQTDFLNRLGKRKPPRACELVEFAGVTGIGQRGDGNVGDVISIDKGLFDRTYWKRYLARNDRIQPKVLAEIL